MPKQAWLPVCWGSWGQPPACTPEAVIPKPSTPIALAGEGAAFRGARSLFSARHAQPLPAECSLHLATAWDLLPSAPHAVQIALAKFYTLARQEGLMKKGADCQSAALRSEQRVPREQGAAGRGRRGEGTATQAVNPALSCVTAAGGHGHGTSAWHRRSHCRARSRAPAAPSACGRDRLASPRSASG